MSRQQNGGQNFIIKRANKSFENMRKSGNDTKQPKWYAWRN